MKDSLTFIYKGFLQSVEIHIDCHKQQDGKYKASCSARLKLPILKKNYFTWTLFSEEKNNWESHSPVSEEGAGEKVVYYNQFPEGTEDPIGFFLKIHRGEWRGNQVNLAIGNKQVPLSVHQEDQQMTVSRAEKNQKLIIKLGQRGIEALEVPIPVLGALQIQRVF